jgi:DNA mismatch endonuclease (patch repair protein)
MKIEISRNKLEHLYLNKKLSIYKIAKLFNVSPVTIHNRMHEYGIPARSICEALKGRLPWNKGKNLSEETKRKLSKILKRLWEDQVFRKKMIISKALKGHKVPVAIRKKIAKSLLGKYVSELNPFYGKHHTKAVKIKSRIRAIKQLVSGELRNRITSIELKMEKELKKRNIYYKKQFPLLNRTVVDFYLPKYKIVVYCDGIFWHKSEWAKKEGITEKDKKQTKVLLANGYKVFRFSETEINNSAEKCVNRILSHINNNYL